MNILVINWQDWTNPLSGGAETHLRETFRRIADMGHHVTLFCCRYPGAAPDETLDGIRILRRGTRNTFNFVVPLYWYAALRGMNFDVVVDDINKIPFYTPLYVRKPLVGLSHHFFGSSIFLEAGPLAGAYVFVSEWLVNFVYKFVPFIVVSQSTLDEFVARGFRRQNFHVAMNAIDHQKLHPAGVPKTTHPTVGYFGRLKKYKSVQHVIQAFARVKRQMPDAELVIIGRGDYQPQLQALALELGVDSSVRFTGFVSEEEKLRLLQELWVVVNPSMKEGWGIVNVEANACGTPAIAADSPGLRDSVRHGHTGLLYPYGDIDALTRDMLLMLRNHDLRRMFRDNALQFTKELTWDASARIVADVLHSVAGIGAGE